MKIPIANIKITKRIRKKIGKIEELADNIAKIGLICPITVMENDSGGYRLIAGLRRLKAAQMLGWTEIEVNVISPVDEEAALRIEFNENEQCMPVNRGAQLETVTAKDLMTQPVEPLAFTIADILPHGLFILSGSSKIGKSWLALDISCAVANGGALWHYPATRGDVLYLALEDNHKRLQDRLNKLAPICDIDAATDVHFVTNAKKLGAGLAKQITAFLDAHPRTQLIVIDTLQYIRNGGKFTGTYSGDYHDMDALREIIAERNLTMLLVTHNHKSDDADPLNRVHGSAGLTGAVDGIFVLEKNRRSGDKARLTVANRDTESHQFDLRFDHANCRWHFIAETGGDDNAEDYLYELLNLLLDETPVWSGTATQLCATLTVLDPALSVSPIALARTLKSQQQYLQTQHNMKCVFTRNKTARFIELSRDVIVVDAENPKMEPLRLLG